MKTSKHSFSWFFLLSTIIVFGQTQTQKINESFDVHKDVRVEINAEHSDITVEFWNKSRVAIQGVLEIKGIAKEEAIAYFKEWNLEALGNATKVVINSKPLRNYYTHSTVFDHMDFDHINFDESVAHIGEYFEGNYYSEMPVAPPMNPMPPMSPLPPFPQPFIAHLSEIEFDYQAYQKDKKGYLAAFEKRQKIWQKEFEKEIKPQMEAYEIKMKQWQKKMEPKMEAFEKRRKEWEKKNKSKMIAHEKKMESKVKKLEGIIEEKYAKKIKEKQNRMAKMKKSLVIKIPKDAMLKVNVHHGKIKLPEEIKTVE